MRHILRIEVEPPLGGSAPVPLLANTDVAVTVYARDDRMTLAVDGRPWLSLPAASDTMPPRRIILSLDRVE